jgi:deoxyadenosine/deoxycytidine kinase
MIHKKQLQLLENLEHIINEPIVISITGKHGVGKSTFAKKLAEYYPHAVVMSLAEPVKKIAGEFGYLEEYKRTDPKHRKLLEDITRIGMDFNIDLWGEKLIKNIYHKGMYSGYNIFIIDDSQYNNITIFLNEHYKHFMEYEFKRNLEDNIFKDIYSTIIKIITKKGDK